MASTYRNTLVCRTGTKRGVVLSSVGENLTDSSGAGNTEVGTFARDFSGVFISNLWTTPTENLKLQDSEFTIVLADGRGIEQDDLDDDNVNLDDDTIDPEEGDEAFINEAVEQWARVEHIDIELRIVPPDYLGTTVWEADLDNGEVAVVATNLANFLDSQVVTAPEGDGDADSWDYMTAHLRWTLHWAISVVNCAEQFDEGLQDFIEENTASLRVANNPVPLAGPKGLLLAYGGAASEAEALLRATRLWMPDEDKGRDIRHVRRGEVELPYTFRRVNTNPSPEEVVDLDILDSELGLEQHGWAMTGPDSQRGKNVVLRVNFDQPITLRDDQMLIFTMQSGRARLTQNPRTAGGGEVTGDYIIAGSTAVRGWAGPTMTLYHRHARIRGHVR